MSEKLHSRLTRSIDVIWLPVPVMASERAELGRESTLQELLNEISSAGKLGIKLLMSLFE